MVFKFVHVACPLVPIRSVGTRCDNVPGSLCQLSGLPVCGSVYFLARCRLLNRVFSRRFCQLYQSNYPIHWLICTQMQHGRTFLLESILVLAFILIKIANRNKKVRVGHHQRVIHISIVAGAINDLSVAERRGSPCLGQDVLLSSIYSKQCA